VGQAANDVIGDDNGHVFLGTQPAQASLGAKRVAGTVLRQRNVHVCQCACTVLLLPQVCVVNQSAFLSAL
jgi:hypothetical protein